MKSINLAEKLAIFNDHWQPRTVGVFNGHDLMVVKVKGEFKWHQHVVPKGMEHCPVAEEEVHMLLIEPTGTPNTGDTKTAAPRRLA